MPTVILLDVSISMAQSIFKINNKNKINSGGGGVSGETDEIKTYFDLLKQAIQHLVIQLQQKTSAFMVDPITLVTYSSDVNILIPFTKEFAEFLNDLNSMDIRLYDRTDLLNALIKTNEIVSQTFGTPSSLSTEIFIFTDQCTAFDQSPTYNKLKQFQFQFIHQFHFISICLNDHHNHLNEITLDNIGGIGNGTDENELEKQQQQQQQMDDNQNENGTLDKSNIIKINNNFRGTIDIVKIGVGYSSSNYNIITLQMEKVLNKIINNNFNLYRCVLVFGRLSSPITLYPNPMTLLNFLNSNNGNNSLSDNGIGSSISGNDKTQMKSISTLSIIGYLPNKSLYNVPSLSRHVIIPLVSDSTPGVLPPLGPVLQNCLRSEKKTAIVYIQDNWFGMINSTFENDTSVLVLSLFEPNLELPFIGDLLSMEVGNLNELQRQQQQQILLLQSQMQQKPQQPLPPPQLPFQAVQSPFTMSYNTVVDPNIIPYIKMDSIHSDFTKISRLFKSLPQKLESIIIECEKIRQLALIYQPSLTDALLELITEEIKTNKIPDEKTYYFLTELILFLEKPNLNEPINANTLANSINSKNLIIQQEQQQNNNQNNNQQQQYNQQNPQQHHSSSSSSHHSSNRGDRDRSERDHSSSSSHRDHSSSSSSHREHRDHSSSSSNNNYSSSSNNSNNNNNNNYSNNNRSSNRKR